MVPGPDRALPVPEPVAAGGQEPHDADGVDEVRRSDLDVLRSQLEAIDRWHEARRTVQVAAQPRATSREARTDLARRLDVVRAEHRAIVERTDAHLRASVELLMLASPRRAVVVHRNRWFADRLRADLLVRGVTVVATLTNGAEAVGAVVVEQPDLLLVEDSLPMTSGEDVVREVRGFAPLTRIGAQVAHDERIAPMLEAGAHTVCTRRLPPADVAEGLAGLLRRRSPVS